MELKLKDLRYLVAVPMSGISAAPRPSASSASRRCRAVAQARESLGVQLIERRPRRVTLTEAGEEIAQRARTMLATGDASSRWPRRAAIRWQASCAWPCCRPSAVPAAADCTQAPQGTAAP